jgi:E3 ubiquitin-protein ligase SHPRH
MISNFNISDLYGLFLFLGLDPFWVKQWFDKMLCTPLCYGIKEPMYEAVSSVLWRTAKKDVIEQVPLVIGFDIHHLLA